PRVVEGPGEADARLQHAGVVHGRPELALAAMPVQAEAGADHHAVAHAPGVLGEGALALVARADVVRVGHDVARVGGADRRVAAQVVEARVRAAALDLQAELELVMPEALREARVAEVELVAAALLEAHG